jgi:hypothetical protein
LLQLQWVNALKKFLIGGKFTPFATPPSPVMPQLNANANSEARYVLESIVNYRSIQTDQRIIRRLNALKSRLICHPDTHRKILNQLLELQFQNI